MRRENSVLFRFTNWREVQEYFNSKKASINDKDAILTDLITIRRKNIPCWTSIMLYVLHRQLISVFYQKNRWDKDRAEFWQNLFLAFLETINGLDLEKRRHRLSQKIFNDLIHRLYAIYKNSWRIQKAEVPINPNKLKALTEDKNNLFVEVEASLNRQSEISRLMENQRIGRISEMERFLIQETRIFQKPLRKYAFELGMPYETLKKRRQRAESKLVIIKKR